MDVLFKLWIVANVIFTLFPVLCGDSDTGYQFVNPLVIYRNTDLNWFGVILLTIVVHFLATVPASLYWCFKLCTIGRKDKEDL